MPMMMMKISRNGTIIMGILVDQGLSRHHMNDFHILMFI